MKIKVYTVCARAQASIFMVFWPFSSKKLPNCWRNLNDERWSSEWSKVKTLEDNQGVDGRFFTNCVRTINEKVVSICLIIPKNRKVKKFQLYIIDQSFEHNGMDTKLPKKVGKPWFEKGGAHFMQACVRRICKLYTKGGPAGKLTWFDPPKDHLDYRRRDRYKDQAPKTLDELRQWLRFAWKNVTLDTLWELVHAIPHRLENIRKHTRRYSGF